MFNHLPVFSINAVAKKDSIAFYELAPRGVNVDMAATLTDVLRNVIFQTRLFEMLAKEDMKLILDNLGNRQRIDPDCSTDACLAEIAGALGVKLIITGNVGKVGGTYVISLRLVDSEQARTINTVSRSCTCDGGELIDMVSELGLELLKVEEKKPAVVAYPKKSKVGATRQAPKTSALAKWKIRKKILRNKKAKKYAYRKSSSNWLWWTLGILVVGGGAALALGGGGSAAGSGGSGGSGGASQPTGEVEFTW